MSTVAQFHARAGSPIVSLQERRQRRGERGVQRSAASIDAPSAFCADVAASPSPDRFGELAQVLGRFWLLWLIGFSALCTVSLLLMVALVYLWAAP